MSPITSLSLKVLSTFPYAIAAIADFTETTYKPVYTELLSVTVPVVIDTCRYGVGRYGSVDTCTITVSHILQYIQYIIL